VTTSDAYGVYTTKTIQQMPGSRLRMGNHELPPVDQYEKFVHKMLAGTRGKPKCVMTGAKLRRAVTMKRNGCSMNEIRDAVGISVSTFYVWLGLLPEGMR